MKKFALFFSIMILLASCTATIEDLHFESADAAVKIDISGSQEVSMDPIDVVVKFTTVNYEDRLEFSFQSQNLTKDNVTLDWKNDKEGILTFTYDDGGHYYWDFTVTDEKVISIPRFDKDALPLLH